MLACAGRTFIAGADISEFGKPMRRRLRDLIATLEEIGKPTVAAIHGTALGGGLELALGCHFRVAVRAAQARPARGQARPAARAPAARMRLPRLIGAGRRWR